MTATLSPFDLANFSDIVAGKGDWFSAKLVRLIASADSENKERLRLAFPDHVGAYDDWYDGKGYWA